MLIENLGLMRGRQQVLGQISARLEPGKVHVVIGPNGTGKTSLLRALFGDLPLAGGRVSFDGQALEHGRPSAGNLRRWRAPIAFMPQDNTADFALTVLEVVVLGRLGRLGLHIDDETLELAMQRLDQAGIAHLAHRDIATLSGGQRQMALFAQVLMREPKIMLLDEPVSALDLRHQVGLLDLVRAETQRLGWITVVVLHDLNLACQYADTLLAIANGGLLACGAPRAVISTALLHDLYGVEVDVLGDRRGNPVIQPLSKTLPQALSKEERWTA